MGWNALRMKVLPGENRVATENLQLSMNILIERRHHLHDQVQ